MKKFLVLLVVAFQMAYVANAQEKMVVKKTDGTTTEFEVKKVERVYFEGQEISLITGNASDITENSAQITYTVEGVTGSLSGGVVLSTNSSLDYDNCQFVCMQTSYNGLNTIKANGLASNTTYYYRAFAMSNGEYYYGEVKSFKTLNSYASNCKLIPNYFVTFKNGFVTNWIAEDNVDFSYWDVFRKSDLESINYDEDEIISELVMHDGDVYNDYISTSTSNEWYQPATEYVLCTISFDNTGKRGELVIYPFTTMAQGLPVATVSGLKPSTSSEGNDIWIWDVSLDNNAIAYYMFADEDSWEGWLDNTVAWYIKRAIDNGQITTTYTWTSVQMPRKENDLLVCLWGTNYKKEVGDYSLSRLSLTSSSRSDYSQVSNYNTKIDHNGVLRNNNNINELKGKKGRLIYAIGQ